MKWYALANAWFTRCDDHNHDKSRFTYWFQCHSHNHISISYKFVRITIMIMTSCESGLIVIGVWSKQLYIVFFIFFISHVSIYIVISMVKWKLPLWDLWTADHCFCPRILKNRIRLLNDARCSHERCVYFEVTLYLWRYKSRYQHSASDGIPEKTNKNQCGDLMKGWYPFRIQTLGPATDTSEIASLMVVTKIWKCHGAARLRV